MFFYKQGRGRTVYDVRDQIAEIYFTLSFFPTFGQPVRKRQCCNAE